MKFTMQLCTCKSYFNYLSKFLFIKRILLFTFREGGACNHIAALLYGIVDITDKKHTGKIAPTSKACGWIKPRSRNLSPQKAQDMNFKKVKTEKHTSAQASYSVSDKSADLTLERKIGKN